MNEIENLEKELNDRLKQKDDYDEWSMHDLAKAQLSVVAKWKADRERIYNLINNKIIAKEDEYNSIPVTEDNYRRKNKLLTQIEVLDELKEELGVQICQDMNG